VDLGVAALAIINEIYFCARAAQKRILLERDYATKNAPPALVTPAARRSEVARRQCAKPQALRADDTTRPGVGLRINGKNFGRVGVFNLYL
jgi:hypothetical protein